jgi:hypothetical protein
MNAGISSTTLSLDSCNLMMNTRFDDTPGNIGLALYMAAAL